MEEWKLRSLDKIRCKEVCWMFKFANLFLVYLVGLICPDIRTSSTISAVLTNCFHPFFSPAGRCSFTKIFNPQSNCKLQWYHTFPCKFKMFSKCTNSFYVILVIFKKKVSMIKAPWAALHVSMFIKKYWWVMRHVLAT